MLHINANERKKKNKIKITDIYVQKWYFTDIFVQSSQHDHIGNHFNDKFVLLYHVSYVINGDEWKSTIEYICRTFYTFGDSILYFHLLRIHLLVN